jgi:SNF2 family DNA or RNA helicase
MGIPTAHVAFVHPQLSRALRTEKFDAFQRELDDSGGLKYKPVRIILAPLTSIAEGITLTKAKYCVLLEPQYKMMMEMQLFGRHGRIGQKNPVTHSFRLYINDGIESKIMARHEHRKQLVPAMSQTIKDRQQLEPKKGKQSKRISYIDLVEA